ncbi:1-acyl-sn-glycerol-3-phosphate acyltransferase [Allocatelliglobosispora scoriae]|uniref:1-acyl-sn-glycerol-3-phosphate acyltransferase n=1 Tax=Allocatelliglobosispora scoriae TaxID=643052 RepID=A0A841BFA5_9ACTN|nr:lysophospholipid acyltransferase family protein [Allocatelliglobosispora scoriae]MBB5866974.1 1-acyl-sn-glycerol-3-phosphate acyltransferase [Allocatelliglobosispora scoriae]
MSSPSIQRWRSPLVWRFAQWVARGAVALVARLEVTGDVPAELRDGPLILAGNHIGPFDPIPIGAATGLLGVHPRIMATGGLFRAPVIGPLMRAAGHLRVNRTRVDPSEPAAGAAVDDALAALAAGSVVFAYPEGRITLDPHLWPERGKTGLARLALAADVPVIPVAQWGSHEVLPYAAPTGMWPAVWASMRHRRTIRIHFGAPVDLSGLVLGRPGDAMRATDRIIAAIRDNLVPLRADEPGAPRHTDPTRPADTTRTFR